MAGYKGVAQGDICGDWAALHLPYSGSYTNLHQSTILVTTWHQTIYRHHTNVNSWVLILCYSYVRCNHLGKLGESYIGPVRTTCDIL